MFLYGLHPNETTRDIMERYTSEENKVLLDESDLFQTFAGRWALRSAVDTHMRGILRKDRNYARTTYDLFFPSEGIAKLPPEKLEMIFPRELAKHERTGFSCPKKNKEFLLNVKKLCEEREIRYVILILPYHPRFRKHFGSEFISDVEEFVCEMRTEHGYDIINCMELFDETAFRDTCHFVESNAEQFAEHIASELEKLGICSSTNQHSSSSR